MAGLIHPPKLRSSSSSCSLLPSYKTKNSAFYKPSWLFILLIFSLSLLTFFRQWQNNDVDNVTYLLHQQPHASSLSASDECITRELGHSSSPDFKGWNFFDDDSYLTQVTPKPASPNVSKVLEIIPGVKVISRTRELEDQQAKSRIWNDTWLSTAFNKPCNSALFVKQTLNMETAIVMARDSGMEWILHVDTDELLHPEGSRNYSMRELLASVPSDVDALYFQTMKVRLRGMTYKILSMRFHYSKKNFDHLSNDSNFELYKMATRGNPNYFLTYANGKSAARIQDHLRPNGAHQWYSYVKEPKEITLDEAAILHYTYARFSDLTSRRDRCNCQPTEEDVKRCFWLEFDRSAFIISSTETHERMLQWYRDHVVWDNDKMNRKLLKYGIFTRIYTPMVIIQKLKESGVFASIISSA